MTVQSRDKLMLAAAMVELKLTDIAVGCGSFNPHNGRILAEVPSMNYAECCATCDYAEIDPDETPNQRVPTRICMCHKMRVARSWHCSEWYWA